MFEKSMSGPQHSLFKWLGIITSNVVDRNLYNDLRVLVSTAMQSVQVVRDHNV